MTSDLIKNRLTGWNVLVVDDEPDSLFVASRWLKLAGANVVTAQNGQAGLEIACQMLPRLIITDLTMPVMDGWELQYHLKQAARTASIPVIALTAHVMQSTKDRVVNAGFIDHISKPLNPTKFLDQVISILENVPELPVCWMWSMSPTTLQAMARMLGSWSRAATTAPP
jgi:CheY-like chemotaxis protein